jgi:hypothetical protein
VQDPHTRAAKGEARRLVVAAVFEEHSKQVADVVVGQTVADGLTCPLEADEAGVAQHFELMGDGRLAHAEGALQAADRELARNGARGVARDIPSWTRPRDLLEPSGRESALLTSVGFSA